MEIYALSDLHIGPGQTKGHFSSGWRDHQPRMRKSWDQSVPANALVLMPGDFTWNQDPADMHYDYQWIADRPGALKIMTRGNHDFGPWRHSRAIQNFLSAYPDLRVVLGDALRIPNPDGDEFPALVIAGCMGSNDPLDKYYGRENGSSSKWHPSDPELFAGAKEQLHASLVHAHALRRAGDHLVVMIHYPPFANGCESTVFASMIEGAGVDLCLFGHLHKTRQWPKVFQGSRGGVEYRFVGADFLGFSPIRVGWLDRGGLHITPIGRAAQVKWIWEGWLHEWRAQCGSAPSENGEALMVTSRHSRSAKHAAPTHPEWGSAKHKAQLRQPEAKQQERKSSPRSSAHSSRPHDERQARIAFRSWKEMQASSPSTPKKPKAPDTPVSPESINK